MLRALRQIMDQPGVIPMRIGVNTGKVFTGDFGPPYRRAYRVFGDAINTAARVMSKADAGQILSTAIVLERSRTTFETAPIEPFQAKGKALLLHAFVVGQATGLRDEQPEETAMLGRNAELAAMHDVLDQVRLGEGWIVEISGAPGLGRTRLLHEFVEHVPDALVLHARCEEYESSTPYFPFRVPMRKVLGVDPRADTPEVEARLLEVLEHLDPSLVPWMPLLGILLGVDLSPTTETARLDEQFIRERLAEVTMQLLVSILAGTATLLAVEDVQYIDEASKDLLLRLSKAGAALRQLLVISHTDSSTVWVSPEQDLRSLAFTLLPLNERQMIEIVRRATYQAPLQAHVVEDIARRSVGNALFLFELLKTVRTTGSAEMLPDSVESVISGEIDRLSPNDRTILRYASVLGTTFDEALLRAAVEGDVDLDDDVWHRFEGLVEVGGDGGCKFRNTLVRDTAYEGLPYRRRRELHERVGEAIERLSGASTEEEVSTLALHYYEAQHHAKAWHYCFLAGNRAKAVAANIEAARFYERALSSARRLRHVSHDERASTWILLSEVQEAGGLFDEAFEALRRATRLLDADPVARATVYGNRSRARSRLGRFTQALRETTTGLRLVEQLESNEAIAVRANLHALRADIRLHQGHPRETIALAKAAVAEAMGSDTLEALARAYTALDGAHQMLGEPEKAVNELKALEIYKQLGNFRSLAMTELNLGVQAYSDGRWIEAVDWYRRARADCLDAGDRPRAALAGANLGELLVSQGAFDEAEAVLTEARHVLRAAGRTPFALFAETQLARLSVARGFPDDAVRALELLVEEAHGIGHAGIALEITIYYAEAMIAAGDHSTTLTVLENADTGPMGDEAALLAVPLARVRASCLMALGRDEEARACLVEALSGAERQGLLYEQLRIHLANVELAGQTGTEVEPGELLEITRLRQLLGLEV
jgi:predicted ATPase